MVRIALNADEFKTLVSGGVVKKAGDIDFCKGVQRKDGFFQSEGVEIILQDIGFELMLEAISEAVDEWVSDYPDP